MLHLSPSAEPAIVSASADWFVVNKPAHLLIHPTRPDGQFTLLEWVRQKFPAEPVAIINRLDRETSGLVLVARSAAAASRLGKMTMRREIGKKYLAIVSGVAPERGTVSAPLDRLGKHRPSAIHVRQAVIAGTYAATTHFTRLAVKQAADGDQFSLLELVLETGRLHQIRVHLAHIGHPVVGDKIYGSDENFYLSFIENGWTDEMQKALRLNRHALHAATLTFTWDEKPVTVSVPLPADLRGFWDDLGKIYHP
ncbi:MAG: RluA family pseudouridine synthase [Verrucomicrobiales bacterium]|jgi:23S rRNA pseudouridine1911/1915/1917 synthase|nr:RluA family pseudouridine synthase [Verrucomicrobiales bacterium]